MNKQQKDPAWEEYIAIYDTAHKEFRAIIDKAWKECQDKYTAINEQDLEDIK